MRALSSSPPLCRRRREETHSLSLSLPSPTDGSSQSLVTSSPTDGSATGLDQSLGTHATCLDIRGRCGLKIRALTGRLGPSNNCSEMRPHLGMRMLLWCCKRRVSSITGDVGRADASAKRTEFSGGLCRYFRWSLLRPYCNSQTKACLMTRASKRRRFGPRIGDPERLRRSKDAAWVLRRGNRAACCGESFPSHDSRRLPSTSLDFNQ